MAERAAGSSTPSVTGPEQIRNVVLVGPSGSGKTTLIEHVLLAHGAISRPGSVESGTTVSDYDDAEHKQQRSVNLSVVSYRADGITVNLLDTPGYADYVGELRAGLRAADCALFVVSAAEPLDGATKAMWQECDGVGMPRAVVVTKVDHPRADYDGTLAAVQAAFGDKVMPLYLPLPGPALAGLLSQRVFSLAGGARTARDPDAEEAAAIEDARGALIEAVIEESEDESLMERYLSGEEIDVDALIDDLETAVAGATLFPVVPVSAPSGLGIAELDEVVTRAFPAPAEHPLPPVYTIAGAEAGGLRCEPDSPLLAEVIKTTSDPYLGRVSVVRVFSGTLLPESPVHVSGHSSAFREGGDGGHADHDEDERVGGLSAPLGKTMRPMSQAVAGDVCAVAKLTRAETGDTISGKDRPLLMQPWTMPEPLLPVAVEAQTRSDEDKLSQGLARLAAEDPTLRIEHNAETHQLVLWTMGESHAEVLLDRLESRYGVSVRRVEVVVPLRETFAAPTSGHGRHVKQSGGHGQYAVCDITVDPLPSGAGFEFVDKVVGGAVPRQFIPSVEKGVLTQMERGVAGGNRVVDVRVTLTDGKAHSVDSSDMAFQTAGALALKDAAERGEVALLEPVDTISVLIDDEYVGAVMGDLSARRARVLGSEAAPGHRTIVRAEAPATELLRYATDLRSLSHGTGSFSRTFARYDAVPAHVAARLRRP